MKTWARMLLLAGQKRREADETGEKPPVWLEEVSRRGYVMLLNEVNTPYSERR